MDITGGTGFCRPKVISLKLLLSISTNSCIFHPNPSETLLGMLVFKLQVGNLSKSLKFKLMTWMRGQGMSAAAGSHSKRDVLLFGRWQGPLRNSKNVLLNSRAVKDQSGNQ